jgi:hypothetical protein
MYRVATELFSDKPLTTSGRYTQSQDNISSWFNEIVAVWLTRLPSSLTQHLDENGLSTIRFGGHHFASKHSLYERKLIANVLKDIAQRNNRLKPVQNADFRILLRNCTNLQYPYAVDEIITGLKQNTGAM